LVSNLLDERSHHVIEVLLCKSGRVHAVSTPEIKMHRSWNPLSLDPSLSSFLVPLGSQLLILLGLLFANVCCNLTPALLKQLEVLAVSRTATRDFLLDQGIDLSIVELIHNGPDIPGSGIALVWLLLILFTLLAMIIEPIVDFLL